MLYFLPNSPTSYPWTVWILNIGQVGCPETSVWNYHYTLHNNPEQRRSQNTLLTFNKFYFHKIVQFMRQRGKICYSIQVRIQYGACDLRSE
jgi:hypothetical protein